MLENFFERILWSSRFMVLVAVICSLVLSATLFIITTIDVATLVSHASHYIFDEVADKKLFKADIIAHTVGSIDGFLLATILLIFALGLYELFISDIDIAKENSKGSSVLIINSLDDLKNKLAKVILMILVVTFFEVSLTITFAGTLDLVYFALGILMVALALFFTNKKQV
jgi:uncharacterized membrane protein YqhA